MSQNNQEGAVDLLAKAKSDLAADMTHRGIGAIIWDNSTAGFKCLPELALPAGGEEPEVVSVTGIYNYNGTLYLIEEGKSGVSVDSYYNHDTEVKPEVVSLSLDRAGEEFGDPADRKGFTTYGDLEEWLAIADCYYQALAE